MKPYPTQFPLPPLPLAILLAVAGCDGGPDTTEPSIITPGWSVDDTVGTPTGIPSPTGSSANTGSDGSVTASVNSADASCNMSGVWIVRELKIPSDTVLSKPHPTSSWRYLEISHEGETFEITRSFSCGTRMSDGQAETVFSKTTTEALMYLNPWEGRSGRFTSNGNSCDFSMERYYELIGLPESVRPALGADVELPEDMEAYRAQAEDWDNDGTPGVGYQTSGPVTGTRHSIQLGWTELASDADYERVPPQDSTDFTVRLTYRVSETIIDADCRFGNSCNLLRAEAVVVPSADNAAHFVLLGRTVAEAAASGVIAAGNDAQTCLNIQGRLVHVDNGDI